MLTTAGPVVLKETVAEAGPTLTVCRFEILRATVGGTESGFGGAPAFEKPPQLMRRASTSATTLWKVPYDGFGVQSDQSTPDCHPTRFDSSARWKLKNAPTVGWQ